MMSDVKDMPAVKEMLTAAEKILGYDLLTLCSWDPRSRVEVRGFAEGSTRSGCDKGL